MKWQSVRHMRQERICVTRNCENRPNGSRKQCWSQDGGSEHFFLKRQEKMEEFDQPHNGKKMQSFSFLSFIKPKSSV